MRKLALSTCVLALVVFSVLTGCDMNTPVRKVSSSAATPTVPAAPEDVKKVEPLMKLPEGYVPSAGARVVKTKVEADALAEVIVKAFGTCEALVQKYAFDIPGFDIIEFLNKEAEFDSKVNSEIKAFKGDVYEKSMNENAGVHKHEENGISVAFDEFTLAKRMTYKPESRKRYEIKTQVMGLKADILDVSKVKDSPFSSAIKAISYANRNTTINESVSTGSVPDKSSVSEKTVKNGMLLFDTGEYHGVCRFETLKVNDASSGTPGMKVSVTLSFYDLEGNMTSAPVKSEYDTASGAF